MGFVRWIATRLVGFAGRPTPTAVVAAAAPAPAGPSPAEIAMLRALFMPTRQGFRSRWWMAMWWLTAVLAIGVVIALVLWISPPLGPDPSTGDVVVLCVVSLARWPPLFASSMLAMTWRADERPAIHVLRQCNWWARIIVPRVYASSVVLIVGLGLTAAPFSARRRLT